MAKAKEYPVVLYHINRTFEEVEVRKIILGERNEAVIKRPAISKLVTVPVHALYIDVGGKREHYDFRRNYEIPKVDGSDSGSADGKSGEGESGDGARKDDTGENDAK